MADDSSSDGSSYHYEEDDGAGGGGGDSEDMPAAIPLTRQYSFTPMDERALLRAAQEVRAAARLP
jgi:hypothetical protein